MAIEDAFLQDILAHPDDDAPRLIYADWLDERNDPRGEFIRVQCVLAHLSDEDPRRWLLEQRQRELLEQHEAKWWPSWDAIVEPFATPHGYLLPEARVCEFRRGFVEQVVLTPEEFLVEADGLFAQAPIRRLHLRPHQRSTTVTRDGSDGPLACISHSPLLGRVTGLSLSHLSLNRSDLRAFVESPHLRQLTELRLSRVHLDEETLLGSEAPWPPCLRRLDLSDNPLSSAILLYLAEAPLLSELRTLNLAHTGLGLDDLLVLVQSSTLTNLTELNLSGNSLTHEAAAVLAEGRLLPQLETLQLDSNLLGDAGALTLRDWPALPRLTRLSLGHNHIFAAGVQALAQAPALRQLIALDLFGNISCDEGTTALASSAWKRLQALNLRFNGVGDRGLRALAETKRLSALSHLNLTANRISDAGARALSGSPGLPSLVRLELMRNAIGLDERQKLRERFGPFVCC